MRTPSLALVTSLVLLAAGCREDVEPTRVSHSPQASRAAATVVTIYPGDDIQAKVNRTPPGSEFRFAAGVHRMERPIRPRTGDTFTKVPGTKPILNGSRLLTGFSKQGRYWVKTGQTQQGPTHFEGERPITCVSNYPRCAHPEDLFINDRLLRHVASLSAVGPGTWYFDYAADKIYIDERDLGTNPSRHKVETGVGPHAFLDTAGVDNVTIRSLTIAKFATPPRRGAIQPDTTSTTSTGWLVEHNEVRWNHAGGISTSTRMVARGNHTHHNGQYGFRGRGNIVLIENNQIAYNGIIGFNPSDGRGGSKWTYTDSLVVRNNFVHHNDGPGLWTDINNIRTYHIGNRVEDNGAMGIFHEISYDAVIRGNTVKRNGFRNTAPLRGGGIAVTNSQNVRIYGNTVAGNRHGIAVNQDDRPPGPYGGGPLYGPWEVKNLDVHHNTVTLAMGSYTGLGGMAAANEYYEVGKNNRFHDNTYNLPAGATNSTKHFRWKAGSLLTEQGWKNAGQDVKGVFNRN